MPLVNHFFGKQLLALAMAALFIAGQALPVLAQTASHSSNHSPINLNLTSTSQNVTAGHLTHNGPVTINVGGSNLSVTGSTQLTPAERLAVYQVVSSGQQSILLGALGNATGGILTLGTGAGKYISGLVIPQGVTVVDKSVALNLTGNLTNNGILDVISSNSGITSASISASNIFNNGLLSSTLSLNLIALNNIINTGIIRSSGNLSLTAGGSITNALPAGMTGPSPVIQAFNNLNLNSANIINSGLMSAQTGNLNIASQLAQDISINNTAGVMQALNGTINVRDTTYSGSGNISMTGGDYLSQTLNLNSGTGAVTVDVGQVTGNLNITAGEAHVTASTPTLKLGDDIVSGDPTYFNSNGSIEITGLVSATEDLAIVATGNVFTNPSDTGAELQASGHNILVIAGAGSISCTGCTSSSTLSGSPPSGGLTSGQTINVSLTGGTGGNIDLSNSTMATAIDTSSGTGAGGNVTLVALAGTNGGGQVILNTSSGLGAINTSGSGTASGGNVTIYAGANSGTTITVNNITTTGGSINLATTQAQAIAGPSANTLTLNASGDIISGSIVPGSALTSGSIVANALNTSGISGGAVTINGGGTITVNNDINTSGNYNLSAVATGFGNGGAVTINAQSDVAVVNGINSSGIYNFSGGGTGGNGGAVTITSGGAITILGNILTSGSYSYSAGSTEVNGGGNGGAVVINANNYVGIVGIITTGTSDSYYNTSLAGGNGGAVTITSDTSSISIGDNGINTSGTANSTVGGYGGGNGGEIILNAATFISAGDINSSGFVTYGNSGNGVTSGNGGAIAINAGTTSSVNSINSSGSSNGSGGGPGGGNGGTVIINSGTNISVTGDINSSGVNEYFNGNSLASGNGGAITINAGTYLTIGGSINASGDITGVGGSAGGGNGGVVTIITTTAGLVENSGISITGGINASGYNQTFYTTSGPGGNGGDVIIASLGTVSIGGSINVTGQGVIADNGVTSPWANVGYGGSVGIAAGNSINVNGISTYSPSYYAGNIFVSSGSSSTSGAVNVGALDTSSGVSGEQGIIFLGAANCSGCTNGLANSNSGITYTTTSSQSGASTPSQAYLFYNTSGNPSTITSDTTLYVTTGSNGVTIYPGVYTSDIGSSITPIALTLELGGDSRTIVPIITTGDMYLTSVTADNTSSGGSLSYQNNGYSVVLAASGSNGISLSGNLTSNPVASSGGNYGDITMVAQSSSSSITQTTGNLALQGNNILLFAGSGGINVTEPSNIDINAAQNLLILTNINGTNNGTSGNGSNVTLAAGNNLYTQDINAGSTYGTGGTVTLTAVNSLTTGNINLAGTNGGELEINASTANLTSVVIAGNINTSSYNNADLVGQGGAITINAGTGVLITGSVNSSGGQVSGVLDSGDAGSIDITANSGSINIIGDLSAAGGSGLGTTNGGAGGPVTLLASLNITTAAINTAGGTSSGAIGGTGGSVELTATNGFIHTTGDISTFGGANSSGASNAGGGGTVTLQAETNIQTNNIYTYGGDNNGSGSGGTGGAVNLTATAGNIQIGVTDTHGGVSSGNGFGIVGGTGGAVTLNAGTNVQTGSIDTQGGNAVNTSGIGGAVNITASTDYIFVNGSILTSGGSTNTTGVSGDTGISGAVTLNADSSIQTGNINTAGAAGSGNGGNVDLTAANNYIITGNIFTTGGVTNSTISSGGTAGTVTLLAQTNIQTDNIDASAGNTTNSTGSGTAGSNIQLTGTSGSITTGNVTTDGSTSSLSYNGGGSGGRISMNAGTYITTGDLDTSGGNSEGNGGNGGNIILTATMNSITTGSITTIGGNNSSSTSGTGGYAGTIALNAGSTSTAFIDTGDINASGGNSVMSGGNASNIDFTANNYITTGSIYVNGGASTSSSSGTGGQSGSVTLAANNYIVTGDISANGGTGYNGNTSGGTINMQSQNSYVQTGNISSMGSSSTVTGGAGGNVTVLAETTVNTGGINTAGGTSISVNYNSGGNVSLTSNTSSVTVSGDIYTWSGGNGGTVTVQADTAISLANIHSNGGNGGNNGNGGTGGNVSLTSTIGSVTVSGDIDSFGGVTVNGTGGNGGKVTIQADTDINVAGTYSGIDSHGGTSSTSNGGSGGDVSITSTSGSVTVGTLLDGAVITTFGGNTSGAGTGGNGGKVTIQADTDIYVVGISANGGASVSGSGGVGGDVSLTSTAGAVTVPTSTYTYGGSTNGTTAGGNGGKITVQAGNDINLYDVESYGGSSISGAGGTGGAVSLTASTGSVTAGAILTYGGASVSSIGGNAGSITITPGSSPTAFISTGDLNASGGDGFTVAGNASNINFSSNNYISTGTINVNGGNCGACGTGGQSGSVTLTAQNNVTTSDISANGGNGLNGGSNGGTINLQSLTTYVETGNISSNGGNSTNGAGGNGGNITIQAPAYIQTSAIQTIGGDPGGQGGNGGNVTLLSLGTIFTTGINSTGGNGSSGGNGGTVLVQAGGDFDAGNILAYGGTGTGGAAGNSGLVYVIAAGLIDTGNIDVHGNTGASNANGGSIKLTAGGLVETGYLDASSQVTGGYIGVTGNTVQITGTNTNGNTVDASGSAGSGGTIEFDIQSFTNPLFIGSNYANNNSTSYIGGNVSVNSASSTAGNIMIKGGNDIIIDTGTTISATSPGGGGAIVFEGSNGASLPPVFQITNNGTIDASGGSGGTIGFDLGGFSALMVLGSGTINAGSNGNIYAGILPNAPVITGTQWSGSSLLVAGSGNGVLPNPTGNAVFVEQNTITGTISANAGTIELGATGDITTGTLTSENPSGYIGYSAIAIASSMGNVYLDGSLLVGHTHGSGFISITAPFGQIIGNPGNSLSTVVGGNISLVASGISLPNWSIVAPGGSIYISSPNIQIQPGTTLTIDPGVGGQLLITTATGGHTPVVQLTSNTGVGLTGLTEIIIGSTSTDPVWSIAANTIYTNQNTGITSVNVLPSIFSTGGTTLTPEIVPADGFYSFANTGTVNLAGNAFLSNFNIPIVFRSSTVQLGTITGQGAILDLIAPNGIQTNGNVNINLGSGGFGIETSTFNTNGGSITLTGTQGLMALGTQFITNGGAVTISAEDILIGGINTSASSSAGQITLNSTGNVFVGSLNALSINGNPGGIIQITATGSLTTSNVYLPGGFILLSANNVQINGVDGNGAALDVSFNGEAITGGTIQVFTTSPSPNDLLFVGNNDIGINPASNYIGGNIDANGGGPSSSGGQILLAPSISMTIGAGTTISASGQNGGNVLFESSNVSTPTELGVTNNGTINAGGTIGFNLTPNTEGAVILGQGSINASNINIGYLANAPVSSNPGQPNQTWDLTTLNSGTAGFELSQSAINGTITVDVGSGTIVASNSSLTLGAITINGTNNGFKAITLNGDIDLTGNILANTSTTDLANITMVADNGSIIATQPISIQCAGGVISLTGTNNVNLGTSTVSVFSANNSGSVYINSGGGSVTVGQVDLSYSGGQLYGTLFITTAQEGFGSGQGGLTYTSTQLSNTNGVVTLGAMTGYGIWSTNSPQTITILPANFSTPSNTTTTITASQIGAGGFLSFNNSAPGAILVLQDDSLYSWQGSVPIVVTTGNINPGTIKDGYTAGLSPNSIANILMVAPTISTQGTPINIEVGGGINIVSTAINTSGTYGATGGSFTLEAGSGNTGGGVDLGADTITTSGGAVSISVNSNSGGINAYAINTSGSDGFGNGINGQAAGNINLTALNGNGGTVYIGSIAAVGGNGSINGGNGGNGGSISLGGDTLIIGSVIASGGNGGAGLLTGGNGGNAGFIGIAAKEAFLLPSLTARGGDGGYTDGGTLTGGGGNGGMVTMLAEAIAYLGNIDTSAGYNAALNTPGGTINLIVFGTLSNPATFTNYGNLITNDGGPSALAAGGTITIAAGGQDSYNAMQADNIQLGPTPADNATIYAAFQSGISSGLTSNGLTITNNGSIADLSNSGGSNLYLFTNQGALAINQGNNIPTGNIQMLNGVITVNPTAASVFIGTNSLVGTLTGSGTTFTASSASTAFNVTSLTATTGAINLSLVGSGMTIAGNGLQAGTNITITDTSGEDFTIQNNSLLDAGNALAPSPGLITLANPGADITVNGSSNSQIVGYVTTPTARNDASNNITITTGQKDLDVFSLKAYLGSINLTAENGSVNTEIYNSNTPQLLAGQNVIFTAAAGIETASGTLVIAGIPNFTINPNVTLPLNAIYSSGYMQFTASNGELLIDSSSSLTSYGNGNSNSSPSTFTNDTPYPLSPSSGDIIIGYGSKPADILALGTNLIFVASNNLELLSTSSVQAVAQYTTANNQNAYHPANTSLYYLGGSLAVIADTPFAPSPLALDTVFSNLQNGRTSGGTKINHNGIITNIDNTGGGAFAIIGPTAKYDLVYAQNNALGGAIYLDPGISGDPGSQFIAIAPPITAAPPPPCTNCGSTPIPPTPPLPELPAISYTQTSLPPTDTTRINQAKAIFQQLCAPIALVNPINTSTSTKLTEDEPEHFNIASGTCQPYAFERDDAVILAKGGTAFATTGDHTLNLKEGRMLAIASGKQAIFIKTSRGMLNIPADTAIIVGLNTSGKLKIINLNGATTQFIASNKNESKNDEQAVPVASQTHAIAQGQEMDLAEDLIPEEGGSGTVVSGSIVMAPPDIHPVDVAKIANSDPLFQCNNGCFTIYMRKKFNALKQQMIHTANSEDGTKSNVSKQNSPSPGNHKNIIGATSGTTRDTTNSPRILGSLSDAHDAIVADDIQPVNFTSPGVQLAGVSIGINTLTTEHSVIKHNGNARISIDAPGEFTLSQGEMLFMATKPTVVHDGGNDGNHRFSIATGTIALISKEDDVIKVRNLYETTPESIMAKVGNKLIKASVGYELIIGSDYDVIIKSLHAESLGHRGLTSIDLPNGHQLIQGEVSLASLINNAPILHALMVSNNAEDKKIASKLAKMAAILVQMTAGRGAYSPLSLNQQ